MIVSAFFDFFQTAIMKKSIFFISFKGYHLNEYEVLIESIE